MRNKDYLTYEPILMRKVLPIKLRKQPDSSKKFQAAVTDHILHHLAFDNSFQANIITIVSSGRIVVVNSTACKLLGYSRRELLTKRRADIFDIKEIAFKDMLKERTAEGHSKGLITAIKKNGKLIPSEITSAVFIDEDGIEKAITTIADLSLSILKQKAIDVKKEKNVTADIALAKSVQRKIDTRKEKIVADNIDLVKSNQKAIDLKREKVVADDIILAKSNQKEIDIKKEKVVAGNIILAKERADARLAENISKQKMLDERLKQEISLKEKQIAEAREDARDAERSDIGRELHDNVNQLLGVSKLCLDMAKEGGENSQVYLNRSSQYTISAIEAIRKLTKGLTTDIIKNLGLGDAIDTICRDTMEVHPVIISHSLESFIEDSVSEKFKMNLFRIVQEQLNNILKHAKATNVVLALSQNKKTIDLTISDNGVGFDTNQKQKGIGIVNIKSRADSYNGIAEFVSRPGNGCVLKVTFPAKGDLLKKN